LRPSSLILDLPGERLPGAAALNPSRAGGLLVVKE
jgi:hypothetical protein